AIDHIIVFAAGRMFSLAFQDFEKVTVERLRVGSGTLSIAFILGLRGERSEGADFAVKVRRPEEAILLSGRAEKFLGKFEHLIAIVIGASVFALGVDVSAHKSKSGQLISANASIEQLLDPGGRVEKPDAVGAREWNGKRPLIRADFEDST